MSLSVAIALFEFERHVFVARIGEGRITAVYIGDRIPSLCQRRFLRPPPGVRGTSCTGIATCEAEGVPY